MTRVTQGTRTGLPVRRTFAASRLAPACLAEAYAALVPSVRRRVAGSPPARVALAPDDARRAGGARR